MVLDLRIPIGLAFSVIGVLLAAFGGATRENFDLYAKSLGINVNLWWGLALLGFGQTLFHWARIGQKHAGGTTAGLVKKPKRRGR